MTKKKIIVANWKMNPRTVQEAKELFIKIRKTTDKLSKVETVICPPFVFLHPLALLANNRCNLGAQNVFEQLTTSHGTAYTGEISPAQLSALGVSYVILGHSERRNMGETSAIVNEKIKSAFLYRLNVILCVGEKERDAEGRYFVDLKEEIKESLHKISKKDLARLVIAYEPIWAVGAEAKKADTPEALLEMVIFIRKVLSDLFHKSVAFQVPILYGGSVNSNNAESFLSRGGVSGLLVGRASLNAKEFGEILQSAQAV